MVLKKRGNILSLLIAIGVLEAAIIPAFAVEIKAKSAAIPSVILPGVPQKIFAASEIGVME